MYNQKVIWYILNITSHSKMIIKEIVMHRNRKGQQMVEYLLLLAAIIIVLLAALYGSNTFRNKITSILQSCINVIADEANDL